MAKRKPFHLLVNDRHKLVILIGDAKNTDQFDLGPALARHDTLPASLPGIRRILAEVGPQFATCSDEHLAKFLYDDLQELAKQIFVCRTHRVVYEANRVDARGDCGGEYFGHPLDDGLPSPDLRDYRIVAIRCFELRWLNRPLGHMLDEYKINSYEGVVRSPIREKLLDDLNRVIAGDNVMPYTDAMNLAFCGAVARSVNWKDDRRVELRNGELKYVGYEHNIRYELDAVNFNDMVDDWIVTV